MDLSTYKAPIKEETIVKSERAELVKSFLDRLNLERGKFKPLTAKVVAVKLGKFKDNRSLYAFYKKCENAKSFGAIFWWSMKQK